MDNTNKVVFFVLFCCIKSEQGDIVVFQFGIDMDPWGNVWIDVGRMEAGLSQGAQIPGGAGLLTDRQGIFYFIALVEQVCGDALMYAMGGFGCCETGLSIVGIEIQQSAARFQEAMPFLIGFLDVRQGPGQVSAENDVITLGREVGLFGIHGQEGRG